MLLIVRLPAAVGDVVYIPFKCKARGSVPRVLRSAGPQTFVERVARQWKPACCRVCLCRSMIKVDLRDTRTDPERQKLHSKVS